MHAGGKMDSGEAWAWDDFHWQERASWLVLFFPVDIHSLIVSNSLILTMVAGAQSPSQGFQTWGRDWVGHQLTAVPVNIIRQNQTAHEWSLPSTQQRHCHNGYSEASTSMMQRSFGSGTCRTGAWDSHHFSSYKASWVSGIHWNPGTVMEIVSAFGDFIQSGKKKQKEKQETETSKRDKLVDPNWAELKISSF